jgi:GNAT superfamily N-acetyltransferase
MAPTVVRLDDPAAMLDRSGAFLRSRPVEHNLILTLLHHRVAEPVPGRYWRVSEGDSTVGVVFQSPPDFPATLTPMGEAAVHAAADAIAGSGATLPGVVGEAATAARFAGRWTELTASAAVPTRAERIYRIGHLHLPEPGSGTLRPAVADDLDLLVTWTDQFPASGMPVIPRAVLAARIDAGQFWLWATDAPVSMAAHTIPLVGVTRIDAVFTPPKLRKRGYAGACVGRLSAELGDRGARCMLYTDLGNPTSNSVYRRLGYEAVSEVLRYAFAARPA